MVDSLAMFFGKKKRRTRKSPKRSVLKSPKKVAKCCGMVVVKGRERKLYKGTKGGMFYKTKSGKTYVDAKFVRKHSPKRMRKSPKRVRKSPKRVRRTRWGYGLGQPPLMSMMGPANHSCDNSIIMGTQEQASKMFGDQVRGY